MTYSTGPFTVDEVGFIQIAATNVLAAVAQGTLDLNRLAIEELANRGMNHQGNWVGFDPAKEILDAYEPRALLPDHPEESGNDYILGEAHRGCWITVGNISVHVSKPIDDDRVHVELHAKGREMDAPADSATMYFDDAALDARPDEPKSVEIPKTARDWLLYEVEGDEEIADKLTNRLTQLLDAGVDEDSIRVQMLDLMMEHRKFGACDTVNRELLERVIGYQFGARAHATPRRPRG